METRQYQHAYLRNNMTTEKTRQDPVKAYQIMSATCQHCFSLPDSFFKPKFTFYNLQFTFWQIFILVCNEPIDVQTTMIGLLWYWSSEASFSWFLCEFMDVYSGRTTENDTYHVCVLPCLHSLCWERPAGCGLNHVIGITISNRSSYNCLSLTVSPVHVPDSVRQPENQQGGWGSVESQLA